MAKPTERALKRKPMAVIILECLRDKVPDVPPEGKDFEWFTGLEAMQEFYDQNDAFHKEDVENHEDMAYLAVEITDTADMSLGRSSVYPETDETKKWLQSVKDDITTAFTPLLPPKSDEAGVKKVKAPKRKKVKVEKSADSPTPKPEDKKERLRKRLAEKKKAVVEGVNSDPPPQAVEVTT